MFLYSIALRIHFGSSLFAPSVPSTCARRPLSLPASLSPPRSRLLARNASQAHGFGWRCQLRLRSAELRCQLRVRGRCGACPAVRGAVPRSIAGACHRCRQLWSQRPRYLAHTPQAVHGAVCVFSSRCPATRGGCRPASSGSGATRGRGGGTA